MGSREIHAAECCRSGQTWHVLQCFDLEIQTQRKSADPCLPGGARPEAVSQSKQKATKPFFLIGSGCNVWHWRSHPRRSKVWDATFDTEDHPNAGPKTVSLGSPGHAVSLFRGPASGKLFRCWVLVLPGVTLKRAQTPLKMHLEANARCKLKPLRGANWSPQLQNPLFFWFWTQRLTLKPLWGANWSPQLQNPLFYRFWTQRLTLKTTPTQVQKRSPWARQAMLFPCFAARLLGSFFGAESWFCRVWRSNVPKRHSRCISKPMRGANWSHCEVQIEALSCKIRFFFSSGRNVWHWSHCEVQIEALSCKTLFFYRFWTQRLTLKTTPTQVQKRSPWARQAMLFPCFAARLLGSFFGAESWFGGCDAQTCPNATQGASRSQCEVQIEATARCKLKPSAAKPAFFLVLDATFETEATARCKLKPSAAKPSFFIASGRNVWHWRPPQHRSKNGLLGLARPCCFPVSRPGFWEAFSVLSPGLAGVTLKRAQTPLKVHLEANARCKLKPSAAKPAFFWFWTHWHWSHCEVQIEALSCKTLFFL